MSPPTMLDGCVSPELSIDLLRPMMIRFRDSTLIGTSRSRPASTAQPYAAADPQKEHVDRWLATLTDAGHLDATVAAIVAADADGEPEPAEVTRARRQQQQLRLELDRVLAAIRAGMDPALATIETRKIQADIATADAIIERWERSTDRPRPLTDADVRQALTSAGGLVGLLAGADRTERTALYQALGIRLTFEKQTTGQDLVHARLQLSGGGGGI